MANKRSRGLWLPALLTLFVLVSVLAGCTAITPIETPTMPADEPPATGVAAGQNLSETALANATYSGIYEEPITLTNGLYEGEPYVAGDAARPIVEFKPNSARYGDLDGDGVEDAVVILEERGGGTNTNYYLAAQLNQSSGPADAGAVLIDGNIQIIDLVIENGQVMVESTARGPGDVNCCASYRTERTFALQDGVLAEAGEPTEPVRVSDDDLNGTGWKLAELAEGEPALEEPPITIVFEDGSLTGSAGCNAYSADFTLSQDNPFIITIGPIVTTRMSCPAPIMEQEAAYLAALEKVSLWGYDTGKLAISFVEEGELHERLLFMATDAVEVD